MTLIVTAQAAFARFVMLLCALLGAYGAHAAADAGKPVKAGLVPADWAYELPEGVTRRESTYYSDDVLSSREHLLQR